MQGPGAVARGGVVVIVLAMLIGPWLSHPDYDWLQHTTSEQGGQGMPFAWLMNLGFAAYGAGCTALALRAGSLWVRLPMAVFGLGLIGAALMSAAVPLEGLPGDAAEDWWHSLFATGLGFGFAAMMAGRLFPPGGALRDGLSWLGLIVAVAIPLAMLQYPLWDGVLQRAMFGVSFVWFWREAGRSRG